MLQAISLILKNEKLHSALFVILVCQYTFFSSYFVAFLCGGWKLFWKQSALTTLLPRLIFIILLRERYNEPIISPLSYMV